MSIVAISFDAAGTLLHFAHPVGEIYAETGARYGLHIGSDQAEVRLTTALAAASTPVPESEEGADAFEYRWWMDIAAEVYGCRDDDLRFQACFSELFHYYAAPEAWRIHDDLPWLLQRLLSDNYHLAICSNFDGRLLTVLDALGLTGYFEAVVIPRLAGFVKPQPGMFVKVAEALKKPPQQILHVGDNAERDVSAAKRMGFLGRQWSLPPEADVNEAYACLKNAVDEVSDAGV
jgi:REG-2-like HAD superfamily hydrolase